MALEAAEPSKIEGRDSRRRSVPEGKLGGNEEMGSNDKMGEGEGKLTII